LLLAPAFDDVAGDIAARWVLSVKRLAEVDFAGLTALVSALSSAVKSISAAVSAAFAVSVAALSGSLAMAIRYASKLHKG
jgi:hypothetical protein